MILPNSVQSIADVIGRDAALNLINSWPKKHKAGNKPNALEIYVPKRLKIVHRLIDILGQEVAQQLCDAFGGEMLRPANCADLRANERNTSIMASLKAGDPISDIAALHCISPRMVRYLKAEMPAGELPKPSNDNQPSQQLIA